MHRNSQHLLDSPRVTALHEEHRGLGAFLTPFAGWEMPLRYAGDLAEHRAVRSAAGLFDLSHMGEVTLRGPQAGAALDFALVGELSTLAVGRARYTMLCDEAGGVLDDLIVYRTGTEAYLVVANAANVEVVVTQLRQRSSPYDVVVDDETDCWSLLGLQGPAALDILNDLVPEPLDGLRYYGSTQTVVDGIPAMVARTGYTGEDGFEIFVTAAAPELWRLLLAAGADRGLTPAGLACRDSLRLEAGMPLYGKELSKLRTPFEAGLGRVVRLDKPGPFVGREALALRAVAQGSEVLTGLVGEGRRSPRSGDVVFDVEGRAIGVVTSGMPSPSLGYSIAMAYVEPRLAAPGTELGVDVRGRLECVTTTPLPFYRRSR